MQLLDATTLRDVHQMRTIGRHRNEGNVVTSSSSAGSVTATLATGREAESGDGFNVHAETGDDRATQQRHAGDHRPSRSPHDRPVRNRRRTAP